MKVAFFSNFLNHHQTPFCNEMVNLLGEGNFLFVASMPTPEEQLRNGYDDCNNMYPYVVKSYESEAQLEYARFLFISCDVVIGGKWSDYHLRMNNNRLIFNYSERLFRRSFNFFKEYKSLIYLVFIHNFYRRKNLYLLCAGSFVAKDYSRFLSYPNKKLKWGYFTEVYTYDIESVLETKRNDVINILWVGRFIELKHPEYALNAISHLIDDGFKVSLTFVGDGLLIGKMQELSRELAIDQYVKFLGPLSNLEVRKLMLLSNIFLFTSDKQEGWGAVLNEAMNSACAVVASDEIGAVGYLIQNGHNGYSYRGGDFNDFYSKVQRLVSNPKEIEQLGRNAYDTMVDIWSPKIAATRFLSVCDARLNKRHNVNELFESGICSKA